jgi:hypothetical protein
MLNVDDVAEMTRLSVGTLRFWRHWLPRNNAVTVREQQAEVGRDATDY